MARDIYYQEVGNPLQPARLPNRRPDLQLPYHAHTPRQDTRLAVKMFFLLALLSIAGMFAQAMHVHAGLAAEVPSLLLTNSVLLAVGVFLLVKAIQQRNACWLKSPAACLLAAFCCLNLPIPFGGQVLITSIAIGIFSWLFATHWTTLCTASPMDSSTAAKLRAGWNGYLMVVALLPLGLLLLISMLPTALVHILAVTVFFCQIVTAAFTPAKQGRVRTAWRALVSWLTYNRRDADVPGIFRSPAGTWLQRMAISGLYVFLLSAAYARGLGAAMNALAHSAEREPDVALAASFFPWPNLSLPPTSIDGAVLDLACLLFRFAIPVAIAFGVPLALTLPVLVQASSYRTPDVTPDNWRSLINEVGRSLDPIERDSLYMGRVAHDGSPLLVPRQLFREHAHFLGDSGAGKTSLGLAPLVEQLGSRGDCSIIVIDLKADSMELYATLAAAVAKARKRTRRPIPIKHFSNQAVRRTFAFNPLLQPYWKDLELYMRTDIQCGALGLTYGADYGEGYYSSANAAVLYHTMKTFPDVVNYRDLADHVGDVVANAKRDELHPEIRKAGVHVKTVLDRLGSFEALNVTPDGGYPADVINEAIDFTKVFTQPEVHYFHLSSTLAPGSSPEIARLATYSLLAAATQVERRHQVYLVIDEFQRMVSRNIEYMLQLARSMGVSIILANQTMQDLRTATADLIPPIESNCRYRQWFAVSSGEDRQRLVESSGQTVDLQVTRSHTSGPRGDTKSVSYQETIVPRLSDNDILLASDHPRQSVVRISRGAGYAQYGGLPFILESNYHISKKQYEDRKATPWPDGLAGSFVPATAAQAPPASSTSGPVVTTEVIGDSAADSVADLFNSFVRSSTPQQPKRRRGNRRKTK